MVYFLVICCTSIAKADDWLAIEDEAPALYLNAVGDPDAEPVIVLHGGPGACHHAVDELAQIIADLGYRAVSYDQRGGGLSGDPFKWSEVTVDAHIRDLDAVRAHLGVDKVRIVGHSWGGMLAAAYATAYPQRIRSLALIGSGALGPPNPDPPRLRDPRIIQFHRENPPISKSEEAELAKVFVPAGCGWLARTDHSAYFQYKAKYAEHLSLCGCAFPANGPTWASIDGDADFRHGLLAAPKHTVVIYGDADQRLASADIRLLTRGFAALRVLPRCGHRPHVECPDALREVLVEHFRLQAP